MSFIRILFRVLVSIEVLLLEVADALVAPASQPTDARLHRSNAKGVSPKPTAAPRPGWELLRRQTSQQALGLAAPGAVCGWIEGNSQEPYACPGDGRTCLGFTQTPAGRSATFGVLGCCNAVDCSVVVSCINSSQYFSSSALCDRNCESDTATLKCTDSSFKYCNSYFINGPNVVDFDCDTTSASIYVRIETTYSGEPGSRSWSPFFQIASTPGFLLATTTSHSFISSSSSSTTTVPSSSPSPTHSGSSDVGPIAGGVVGGIAVVAITITILVFLCLRHRRRYSSVPAEATQDLPEAKGASLVATSTPIVLSNEDARAAPGPKRYGPAQSPTSPGAGDYNRDNHRFSSLSSQNGNAMPSPAPPYASSMSPRPYSGTVSPPVDTAVEMDFPGSPGRRHGLEEHPVTGEQYQAYRPAGADQGGPDGMLPGRGEHHVYEAPEGR